MMMNTRKVTNMGSHERMSAREKEKKEKKWKKNIEENFFFIAYYFMFFVSYWDLIFEKYEERDDERENILWLIRDFINLQINCALYIENFTVFPHFHVFRWRATINEWKACACLNWDVRSDRDDDDDVVECAGGKSAVSAGNQIRRFYRIFTHTFLSSMFSNSSLLIIMWPYQLHRNDEFITIITKSFSFVISSFSSS